MTVVNVNFTRERGVMVCDTLAYIDGRPAQLWSKFDLFPTLHAVMSARGLRGMHMDACRWLNVHAPADLDAVANGLPAYLARQAAERAREGQDTRSYFWILGFDRARGEMRLLTLLSDDDFAPVWAEPGTYLNPPAGDGVRLPAVIPDPARVFAKVAVVQKAMMEKSAEVSGDGSYDSIGGEVEMVEMTAKAIRVTTIHRFDDYDAAARQVAEGRR